MNRLAIFTFLVILAVITNPLLSSAQSTLRGTIFSISPGPPPRLVLNVDRQLIPITITPTTRIQIRSQAGTLVPIQFSELQVGDEVSISVTPRYEATTIVVVGRTIANPPSATPAPGPSTPGTSPQPPATSPPSQPPSSPPQTGPSSGQSTQYGQGRIGVWVDGSVSPLALIVVDGGPAAQAGIQTGDRVVEVNGQQVVQLASLVTALSGPVGRSVEIVVQRGEEKLKFTVSLVDARTIQLDSTTFPSPANKVWPAIADVVTSSEPVFGRLAFSRLYNVKSSNRELGIISFETYLMDDAFFVLGPDGLQALFGVPRGFFSAQWERVRITPSMRIAEKAGGTSVRVTLVNEGWSSIVGWTRIGSTGAIEGYTLAAILRRLR